MKKEFTCIVCPMSCHLTVYKDGNDIVVEGNSCKRGKIFGENEFINPKRMLTTTVKITGSHLARLPVISNDEIPKSKIFECVNELYKITVEAPIKRGYIIMKDICGTGIDIVASRSIKKEGI
jgi:CxxC motif-containing protein